MQAFSVGGEGDRCKPQWKATGAAIDHTNKDGRYPFDHYPVTAELNEESS